MTSSSLCRKPNNTMYWMLDVFRVVVIFDFNWPVTKHCLTSFSIFCGGSSLSSPVEKQHLSPNTLAKHYASLFIVGAFVVLTSRPQVLTYLKKNNLMTDKMGEQAGKVIDLKNLETCPTNELNESCVCILLKYQQLRMHPVKNLSLSLIYYPRRSQLTFSWLY